MNEDQVRAMQKASKQILEAYTAIASVRDQLGQDRDYINLSAVSAIACNIDIQLIHGKAGGIASYLSEEDIKNANTSNFRTINLT